MEQVSRCNWKGLLLKGMRGFLIFYLSFVGLFMIVTYFQKEIDLKIFLKWLVSPGVFDWYLKVLLVDTYLFFVYLFFQLISYIFTGSFFNLMIGDGSFYYFDEARDKAIMNDPNSSLSKDMWLSCIFIVFGMLSALFVFQLIWGPIPSSCSR